MSDLLKLQESRFSESVRTFLPLVTSRAPYDEAEREELYRLRYAAYLREGALPPGAPEIFKDAMDERPNAITLGFYIGGALSSSIRLHVATRDTPVLPAMKVFADHLQPFLSDGLTIIDPTRFVVEAAASRLYPKLPYVTVRAPWMACDHFGADLLLATVRAEHQPFYRRLFGHTVVCDPRPYPSLAKPISLMVLDYARARERVMDRYPFMVSTEAERRQIFGSSLACRNPGGTESPDEMALSAPI